MKSQRLISTPTYHISLHLELCGMYSFNHIKFCQWAQQNLQDNHSFFAKVLFTNETTFTNHRSVHLHNTYYWAVGNLHWLQVEHHNVSKCLVWYFRGSYY
jgi:hypothetical protein